MAHWACLFSKLQVSKSACTHSGDEFLSCSFTLLTSVQFDQCKLCIKPCSVRYFERKPKVLSESEFNVGGARPRTAHTASLPSGLTVTHKKGTALSTQQTARHSRLGHSVSVPGGYSLLYTSALSKH